MRSLLAREETTAVCAFDLHAGTWAGSIDLDDGGVPEDPRLELRYGDIAEMETVRRAVRRCDAIVHTTVATQGVTATSSSKLYSVGEGTDDTTWLVNLKGLWNVLECAREEGVGMVVHIGSCHHSWPGTGSHLPPATAAPGSVFMDANARRPDGGLYATQKRMQEEMCRQQWEAHGLKTVVLRPDYIVDMELKIGRHREPLDTTQVMPAGNVCRNDIATACVQAIERRDTIGFEILHVVNTGADQRTKCNVSRTESLLGVRFRSAL